MVDLGFLHFQKMKLRFYGINNPKLRGLERKQGIIDKDILREIVLDKEVKIYSNKINKVNTDVIWLILF